jgi:hypothetical protein
MYDFLDRPVADLPAAERRLLGATRTWVHQLTMAGAGSPAAAQGLGDASDAFDAAMRALDEASTDTLVFQRPCHSTVSETEAVWLGLWKLVRADRLAQAKAALAGFVEPRAAGAVLAAMMRVATHG